MKKTVSLLLVLCLCGISACALAALPAGYVYEPQRGDTGGVIAAEISRLNDNGVADTAAIMALPPSWQVGSASSSQPIDYDARLNDLLKLAGFEKSMLDDVKGYLITNEYLPPTGSYSSKQIYDAILEAKKNGDWPPT